MLFYIYIKSVTRTRANQSICFLNCVHSTTIEVIILICAISAAIIVIFTANTRDLS